MSKISSEEVTEMSNTKSKKDIYGSELLPEGVCLEDIKNKIKDTNSYYTRAMQRMRILDGADRGKVWDVV